MTTERFIDISDRHLEHLESEKRKERDSLLTRLSFVLMALDQIQDELKDRSDLWPSI